GRCRAVAGPRPRAARRAASRARRQRSGLRPAGPRVRLPGSRRPTYRPPPRERETQDRYRVGRRREHLSPRLPPRLPVPPAPSLTAAATARARARAPAPGGEYALSPNRSHGERNPESPPVTASGGGSLRPPERAARP